MGKQDYSQARIIDLKGKRDVSLSVDFTDDPDFKDCVMIELGGEQAIVSIKDLYAFIFAVVDEHHKADMIPVTQTTVHKLTKFHKIQVKKALKPGDFLMARCEVNVPVEVVNGLRGGFGNWIDKPVRSQFSAPILKK